MDRVSTSKGYASAFEAYLFQSLVRDGSCFNKLGRYAMSYVLGFNPSFGMDRVSTHMPLPEIQPLGCFNPSFGMDRVSTHCRRRKTTRDAVSIPRSGWIVFQRLMHETVAA